ncbi:MAG: 3-hydroxyacyl-CoA dehydrogenase [Telmatospirillum sp.]|nr:3-hydroxyacyl-CoA dehydrogenase [Telmatospirillum sp.]
MSEAISHVAVIGAGTIGASWAVLFLAHGCEVSVYDTAPGIRDVLDRMLTEAWPALERLGAATGAPDRGRLRFATTIADAVAHAHFVQESGPEDPALKGPLLSTIDRGLPPDRVIASSTSGFTLDMLRGGLSHPERVLIGHPFNPPHLLPLVEVVADGRTAPAALETALAFYRRMGKSPIHLTRSVLGHVANRLQAAIWREAIHLIDQGVATLADIDDAVALGPGLRWAILGPSATFHLGGGPGGLSSFIEKLGPAFESYWADLGTPHLTPDVRAKLEAGVAALPERDHLRVERDRKLVEVLALLHGKDGPAE